MLKIGSDQENTNSPSKPNTNKDFMRQLSVQELFDGTCYMQTQVVFFLYFPPKYPYTFIHSDKKSRKFITIPPMIIALL